MSASCLINNYQTIKSWSKELDQDFPFLNPNDFELSLEDISVLQDKDKYKNNFKELRWFMFDKPNLYTKSLDNYASYLLYVIVMQMYHNKSFSIGYYESYFTEQLAGFLQHKKDLEKLRDLSLIRKYWDRALTTIEYLVNYMSNYKKVVSNTSAYFNTNNKYNYKIKIPFIGFKKESNEAECSLLLPFSSEKPSWYTIPSIFKMYKYYASQDILISKVHIYWFNLDSFLEKPIIETIPTTQNVAKLVERYSDIEPYPYVNIFNKSNKYFYNKTPLEIILK